MKLISEMIGLVICFGFLGLWLWSVAWAIGDAQKRGQSGGLFLLLAWIFGPFTALFWFIARPSTTVAERSSRIYLNADDSLADASRLDQLGEWDQAIELYRTTAERWPEHRTYITECLRRIEEKRSRT